MGDILPKPYIEYISNHTPKTLKSTYVKTVPVLKIYIKREFIEITRRVL
jgi:hypothetical protein